MPKYDRKYVVDNHHFKDKKCSHDDTLPYDGKFKKETTEITDGRDICVRCGLVSEWAKHSRKGLYAVKFPKVK